MRATLCALLCALALAAVAACGAAAGAPPASFFGMNAQGVFKLPEGEWDRQLAAIARTGVGVVRRDAFWSEVERSAPVAGQHHYAWARPDAIAAALARHGLRWYPILDYATPWSGTVAGPKRWKSAPADRADFAAYAAAFARRYGAGGTFWAANPSLPQLPVQDYEVWNEPNLGDFWPDVLGAADRYADLLAATAAAVRGADPQSRVVVGGLSPTGLTTFLDRVEARRPGLIAAMDAVAFHAYGTTFANTGARVRTLRDWLDAHGAASLSIEITETGWATPPLPESTRAVRMSALVPGLADSSCDISRFIVHTWVTPDTDPSDPNDFFGVVNADATLKPTGIALVDAIAAVEAGAAVAPSDPCAGRSVVTPPPVVRPAILPTPPPSSVVSPAVPPGIGSGDPSIAGPAPLLPGIASPSLSPARTVAVPGYIGPLPFPSSSAHARHRGRIGVHASRTGGVVVIEVRCPRACRSRIRVRRRGGKRVAASAIARFARRHRTSVRLPAGSRGALTALVRVQMRGTRAVVLRRVVH